MKPRRRPPATNARARPLAVEERQAMIIDATMPLLVAHGRDLTSKQIAEAAGVAEGTIFRAFGDKESLIEATIAKTLDPEPLRLGLRAIQADLPLETKIHTIVVLMQSRFSEVFRVMASMGIDRPPKNRHHDRHDFSEIVSDVLAPDLAQLNISPAQVAQTILLLTFAASLPHLNENATFTANDLTQIVLYGIVGKPSTNTEFVATEKILTESQD